MTWTSQRDKNGGNEGQKSSRNHQKLSGDPPDFYIENFDSKLLSTLFLEEKKNTQLQHNIKYEEKRKLVFKKCKI